MPPCGDPSCRVNRGEKNLPSVVVMRTCILRLVIQVSRKDSIHGGRFSLYACIIIDAWVIESNAPSMSMVVRSVYWCLMFSLLTLVHISVSTCSVEEFGRNPYWWGEID